jgi:hypothetical protein
MVIQKLPTEGVITQITNPIGKPLIVIPPESFAQYVNNCVCSTDACTIVDESDGPEIRTSEDYPYDYVVINIMDDYTWTKKCNQTKQ